MGGIVDIRTGKIIGAEKGTRTYYHEEGHIVFNSTPEGMTNAYRRQLSLLSVVLFNTASLFLSHSKYLALTALMLFGYYYWKEENWCWKYADAQLAKYYHGRRNKKA